MKKYYIITFGCQMNKSDSERIAALLEKSGYQPARKETQADLIVANMCSVKQSAVDRAYGLFPKFKKLKSRNPKLRTALTGCILKTDRNKLRKRFDEIWENKNYLNILPKSQSNSIVYIPISNGCNNSCRYCVVPFVRGPLICRNHEDVLKEAKNAIQKKYKEIWLLGQNVNDYQSPTNPSINFAKLLKMINDVSGDFKILFTSPHPKPSTSVKLDAGLKNFSWDELIETLVKCEKFGKYFNLPVQSGDNQILKKMNRNYTIKEYINLVKKIQENMPEIKLSTDVIVGFPGETKKQFQNTVKLFREIKFDNAYISKYSPRPGTAAWNLKDDIPLTEKKKREKTLRGLLRKHG